jgi:hypothetical protein
MTGGDHMVPMRKLVTREANVNASAAGGNSSTDLRIAGSYQEGGTTIQYLEVLHALLRNSEPTGEGKRKPFPLVHFTRDMLLDIYSLSRFLQPIVRYAYLTLSLFHSAFTKVAETISILQYLVL